MVPCSQINDGVFPILCKLVEPDVISVTDGEMLDAVMLALRLLKVGLERMIGSVYCIDRFT